MKINSMTFCKARLSKGETPRNSWIRVFSALMMVFLSHSLLWASSTVNFEQAPQTTNFITEWSYPNGSTSIAFNSITLGVVNYTWSAAPSGNSGSGSFSAAGGLVTLTGLTIEPGDVVTLSMEPANLRAFYMISTTANRANLYKVVQWGAVPWSTMSYAFNGCLNLTITATDAPNLAGVVFMTFMFADCNAMNQDISHWDVSTVTNFESMFQGASIFNQNLNTWNTANATTLRNMFFRASAFNQPIGGWYTENVTNMSGMFSNATAFNQDISGWNTAKVTDFSSMFNGATAFNQPIGVWNTSAATNITNMFFGASSFNQPIGNWDIRKVKSLEKVFTNAIVFNQDISTWNTDSVTTLAGTFNNAKAFNQDISGWNTSRVTSFNATFFQATVFNQPIGTWNTSAATTMREMFFQAPAFNQPIGSWNVSNVTDMRSMFIFATNFNQDLSAWNVSNVTDLTGAFLFASSFNRSLGSWQLNSSANITSLFQNSGLNCANYSQTLFEWANNPATPSGRSMGAAGRTYGTNVASARSTLINSKGWTITGDVAGASACDFPQPFVTEWTVPVGSSEIVFNVETADADVAYFWSVSPSGVTGSGSFRQTSPGAVTISSMSWSDGDVLTLRMTAQHLKRFFMGDEASTAALTDVKQWGSVGWTSMEEAFKDCENLTITATTAPNLSMVTSMADMFRGATIFNSDISSWNTANVTDMSGLFRAANTFNQNIGSWNTANVTSMANMFSDAVAFNQDISGWNTAIVTDMSFMFADNTHFNQDLSSWNTSSVTNMNSMFADAFHYNQLFTNWTFDQVTDLTDFLSGTAMDCDNYTETLLQWANNTNTPQGLTLGAAGLTYGTGGVNAHNKLTNDFGWTIAGDQVGMEPCVDCPDLSSAPAPVSITNSTCTSNCAPSGGSFTAPSSPCPDGAKLQYQVNSGSWTEALPVYAQTGPAQTIKTRCICENNDAFISPPSDGVTTVPGTCTLPDASISGASTICAGGSTTLTADGGSTYSWSSGATTAATTVSPVSTSTYRVTVTATNGCTDTASVQVTVLPLPTIACPSDMMVNTDVGTGDCSGLASWTHPLETAGACTPLVLQMRVDNGTPSVVSPGTMVSQALSVGMHTIAYTITDGGNNMNQCSFTIQVRDNENPALLCQPVAEVKFNGESTLALNIQTLTLSSDNCGITNQLIIPEQVTVDQLGQTVPVNVMVMDEAGNTSVCQVLVQVKGLPRGWRHSNGSVGDCTSDVSYSGSTGVWSATASNCRNTSPYQSDKLMFAQYQLCGDGSITAQVTGLDGAQPFGGVIMRESASAGAKKVQMMINRLSNVLRREIRTSTGGDAFPMDFPSPSERKWLRLIRTGNQFRGYTSSDGIIWWYVMNVHVPMHECIEIGLVLANMQSGVLSTATFANVSTTGGGQMDGVLSPNDAVGQDAPAGLDVQIFPNPTDGLVTIDMPDYLDVPYVITLQDIRGQVILQQDCQTSGCNDSNIELDLRSLSVGVYLMNIRTEGLPTLTRRIVIQR